MEKCTCYHEEYETIGWFGPDEKIRKLRKRCNGTKERDECSCGGDITKCDFYPEIREKAKKEKDFIEVVRCYDCDVPHNKWTGCPKLRGLVTPPDFYCAFGVPKAKNKN